MGSLRLILPRLLLTVLLALALPVASAASLQALIDATPAGGTLQLRPGSYVGPVSIDKPLTLDGLGRARIVGSGRGTVLSVAANGVTLRGLHIGGSGESHDGVDAGILLEGDDHRVEDNVIEDVLFGIHLKRVNRSRVARNRVTGKPLEVGMRGDAIRLWYSQHNVIEANRFRRGRDLTFANSADNRIAGNHFVDGRYGMHVIFSPRLVIEGNRLSDTGTGIIVLYSPDLVLRGNYVAHALTGGGGGIVFKESNDALVEGNEVLHCTVGLRVDAPPESAGKLTVRNNRFAYNIIGLFFYGEAGGHRFHDNRFENNLTTVGISAPGAGSANVWRGNYWDDYQGFDRDGDGIGDTPHEIFLFADRIWMETPMTTFFRNSPVLETLDFLERLAPFSSPHLVLRDPAPRMK
ncbi:nitrous oxide reductase family maturation protein NosD [Sulfuritalea sp.]|uniref:nitrous oxide reductase family maturation protein NosD n=1 Tax=Sulfuritalea sp. TaxID=2480090 RepID=UPI001AD3DBD4|nr:nitrous oxide reductase family maturation protein NosD [Sulfuritalea sp.]MBN8476842.1 nitrous oxide reductase family maturation protein NosD [Sulfuritalea sp.]